MPILDILDKGGRLLPGNLAGLIVLGTMLYPTKAASREVFLAAGLQDALQRSDPPVAIPPEIARPVFKEGGEPGIMDVGLKQFCSGLIAGEVLLRVIQLAAYAPEHASVRKAQYLVKGFRRELKYRAHARGAQASLSAIETAWYRFKPVCHLWAAFIPYWIESAGSKYLLNNDRLPEVLGDAHWLALEGIQHRPPRTGRNSQTVLSAADIWMVPDSPDILKMIELEPPALSAAECASLEQYSHK